MAITASQLKVSVASDGVRETAREMRGLHDEIQDFLRAVANVGRGAGGFNAVASATDQARQSARRAADEMQHVGRAADRASGDVRKLSNAGDGLGSLVGHAGKAAAALAAISGVAAAAGLGATVKVAADFQQALADVGAATGATGDQMAAMRKEALGIGKDTSKGASEAVTAMGELVRSGVAVEDVVGGVARTVVQLSEATSAPIETMATLMSDAMNVFHLGAADATGAANMLAKAAGASSIDIVQLQQSMAAGGLVASQAGLSIEEFATAIGIMGNQGLKASDAGTSLKSFISGLTPSSVKAASAMDKLGFSAFDASGKYKAFPQILNDLSKSFSTLTEEERATTAELLFGSDGIRSFNALIPDTTKGLASAGVQWEDFGRKMAEAPSIAQQSAAKLNTLKGQIELFKGSLETVAITVGTALLPALTNLATLGGAALDWLLTADWSTVQAGFALFVGFLTATVLPALQQFAAFVMGSVVPAMQSFIGEDVVPKVQAFAAVVQGQILPAVQQFAAVLAGTLGPALQQVFGFIGEHKEILGGVAAVIGGVLVAAMTAWAVSATAAAVATVAAAAPVIAIGVAVAALAAGIIYLVKNWDEITEKVPELATALEAVQQAARVFADFVQEQFRKITRFATEELPKVGEAAVNAFDHLQNAVEGVLRLVMALWEQFGSDIVHVVTNHFKIIGTVIQTQMNVVAGIVKTVAALINGDWSRAWESFRQIFVDIFTGISTVAQLHVDSLLTIVRGIAGGVSDGLSNLGGIMGDIFQAAWDGVVRITQAGITEAIEVVRSLPGRVAGAVGDLSGVLVAAGRSIVTGLINGITSAIPDLIGKLGEITSLIPLNKGPLSDDLKLLEPAGEAILEGLINGMRAMEPQIAAYLAGLTNTVSRVGDDLAAVAVTTEQAGQTIVANVTRPLLGMRQEISRLDAEMARLNLQLAHTEPMSEMEASIKRQIDILGAWKNQTQAVISVQEASRKEWELSRTALDHFTTSMARLTTGRANAAAFGPGAAILEGIMDSLMDPAAGAKVAEALDTLLSGISLKDHPGAAALSAELQAVVTAAMADPTNAEATGAVAALLARLQEQVQAAGALTADSFATAFGAALASQDLAQKVGSGVASGLEELHKLLEEGGKASKETVAKMALDVQNELNKIPEFMRGQLGADFANAMNAFIAAPSEDGFDRVVKAAGNVHAALELIPADFAKLPAPIRASIQQIVADVRGGALSVTDAKDRIAAALKVLPSDFAKLDAAAQEAWMNLALSALAGADVTEQAVDSLVANLRRATEEAQRAAAAVAESLAIFGNDSPLRRARATSTTVGRGGNSTIWEENFGGIAGLTRVSGSDEFGPHENFSFPDWLVAAYGGNIDAIIQDMKKGLGRFGAPKLARGTTDFRGGPAVVGEKGFEIVGKGGAQLLNLARGADVLTHDQAKQVMKALGIPGFASGMMTGPGGPGPGMNLGAPLPGVGAPGRGLDLTAYEAVLGQLMARVAQIQAGAHAQAFNTILGPMMAAASSMANQHEAILQAYENALTAFDGHVKNVANEARLAAEASTRALAQTRASVESATAQGRDTLTPSEGRYLMAVAPGPAGGARTATNTGTRGEEIDYDRLAQAVAHAVVQGVANSNLGISLNEQQFGHVVARTLGKMNASRSRGTT